ncbi:MAG TPA: tetratricopeptide repeat protein [Cyclobacteriaceae bacterium]|nr:tetratricopeptide repeat protein [Cyclobacteriaceae bacterium]
MNVALQIKSTAFFSIKMRNAVIWILILLLSACSAEKTGIMHRAFHNTTAHYNAYYYAQEKVRQVEEIIERSFEQDYNKVLRLYPALDSNMAKQYKKDTEEAIKKASIAIERHPNSKWVDDSYMMVGLARMYDYDFVNAIQTFKYINKISKDHATRHKALIYLMRTFTESGDYQNAAAVYDYLRKQKLSNENQKNLYLQNAYLYQVKGDYDKMIFNLSEAESYLKKKDGHGRIYFIIGQVYQTLGFESEAHRFYKKCLGTNPSYELDFYSRLNMAQVTELSSKSDIRTARKHFAKLLKDKKNREFKDKIYYEMAEFEFKQNNLDEALEYFNQSVRNGKNNRVKGLSYLRLGQIHYDSLKKYEISKAYYDSALSTLPKDFDDYEKLEERQKILADFVEQIKTIQLQDSLLSLAQRDTATVRKIFEAYLEAEELAKLSAEKKAKKPSRTGGSSSSAISPFDTGNNSATSEWYFTNPSAIALGQNEFQRVWGNINLDDNWRRSTKTIMPRPQSQQQLAETNMPGPPGENIGGPPPEVSRGSKLQSMIAEVPRSAEKQQEALNKIEVAMFKLGDIYYFQLYEKLNAYNTFNKLLSRFPETKEEAEILYKLYLLAKDLQNGNEGTYANALKSRYPNSNFTRILLNPNYLIESNVIAEQQKAIYKDAYEFFRTEEYELALIKIDDAMARGETSFSAQLELLRILIMGKTENIFQYQLELDNFIKRHAEEDISKYANTLLASSREVQKQLETMKGINYLSYFDEPHYFILLYKTSDKIGSVALAAVDQFDKENYKDGKLTTSTMYFNDEQAMILVAELKGKQEALKYYRDINQTLNQNKNLLNFKFNKFVITKDNFDIFYRTKGLNEYLKFFDKNYVDGL